MSEITKWLKRIFSIQTIAGVATIIGAYYGYKSYEENKLASTRPIRIESKVINSDNITSSEQDINTTSNEDKTRDDVLRSFCGHFCVVIPGLAREGATMVQTLVMDPINSTCKYDDDNTCIEDSKGYYCSTIKEYDVWEIYSFSLRKDNKYAIAEMRRVDKFHGNESQICEVKLELDDYDNIKMSFIEGNDAPGALIDENGGYTDIATFKRE